MDNDDTESIPQVYVNQDPFEWPEVYQGEHLRKMVQEYNDTADGLNITVVRSLCILIIFTSLMVTILI